MKVLFVVAAATALVAYGSQAPVRDQQRIATAGTARITGTVLIDDETRKPLRQATVNLSRANIEDMRAVATDEAGRFAFEQLPAGSYTLSASKGAYISMGYGAAKPGMPGTPIALIDGQTFVAQPLALMKGAVLAGRISDRAGRPVERVVVQAYQVVTLNGERRRRTPAGPSATAETNAHGDYRMFGLSPGSYIVASTPVGAREVASSAVLSEATAAELSWAARPTGQVPPAAGSFMYAPTVFPGTANAGAGSVLTLEKGEERLGIDFALQTLSAVRVTGLLRGTDGRPTEGTVYCLSKDPGLILPPSNVSIARVAPDGTFACAGMPPGDYFLSARVTVAVSPDGGGRLTPTFQWGVLDVSVGGRDVTGLTIQVQPGASVVGRVVFQSVGGTSTDPARSQILFSQQGNLATQGTTRSVVAPDGTFRMDGLPPGSFRLIASGPATAGAAAVWSLRSAMLAGRDVADAAFDLGPGQILSGLTVTFVDTVTELSGLLTDSAGRASQPLYVFVFPTDKNLWGSTRRVKSVRSNDSGAYSIADLPPGEYYLCALTEFETALQYEPGYFEQLIPFASKIAIGEGEKKRQDLKVGR